MSNSAMKLTCILRAAVGHTVHELAEAPAEGSQSCSWRPGLRPRLASRKEGAPRGEAWSQLRLAMEKFLQWSVLKLCLARFETQLFVSCRRLDLRDERPFRTFQERIPGRAIQNVPLPLAAQRHSRYEGLCLLRSFRCLWLFRVIAGFGVGLVLWLERRARHVWHT